VIRAFADMGRGEGGVVGYTSGKSEGSRSRIGYSEWEPEENSELLMKM
jgi:hypothetical protein